MVDIVRAKERNCLVFRCDMKGAYKQFPVCLGDIHLLGFYFEGKYYFDITLPMGLVNSALICQMVSDAVIYIYQKEGYSGVNYLDDLGSAEVENIATQAYQVLAQIMESIGLVEADDKAVPPSQICSFLGILINTIHMRIEIVPERLVEIKEELQSWLHKSTASLRELQSLVGKLSFCATTVRAGRLFFSRILAFLKTLDKSTPHVQCEIDFDVFKDISWWIQIMPQFNGISMIPDKKWIAPSKIFSSDACLSGIGGWSDGDYFHKVLPDFIKLQGLDINEIECLAVMICLKAWGYKLSGKNVLIRCDNNNSVRAINTGRSQSLFMQSVLREICYMCAINDTLVRACWIEGVKNSIPDRLSCFHLAPIYRKQFLELTTGVKLHRTVIADDWFLFSNVW